MVRVIGGGPAGAAAAIAALKEGANVEIYEQSPLPQRRKVCGEFLSPGALVELERIGLLDKCADAKPTRLTRLIVHVGSCEKRARLPGNAWGLSRCRLDQILLDHAVSMGARLIPERREPENADVVATGRPVWFDRLGRHCPGGRLRYPHLTGFGAHYRGGAGDATEILFFQLGCVGLTPIEAGMVSVCGLVRESELEEHGFDPDAFLASRPDLVERLRPLSRATDWLLTGPVISAEDVYWRESGSYLAGDALVSPEPFTGSGVLNALITGRMAGVAATYRRAVREYYREASSVVGWRVLFGSTVAAAIDTGWARILAPITPVEWIFRLSQPRVAAKPVP